MRLATRHFAASLLALICASTALAQTYASGACRPVPGSKTCVDATPCKTSESGVVLCLTGATLPTGAISVGKTCWQYSYRYSCAAQSEVNTCSQYQQNGSCTIISSECADRLPETGQCIQYNNRYQCQTGDAVTQTQISCSSGLFAAAMPAETPRNDSFVQAAIAQEIMRESQVYNSNGTNIFSGVSETCSKGYFGIKNCCNSAPGGRSNAAVMNLALSAAGSTIKYIGGAAIDKGSQYVFDAMYSNGIWTNGLTANFLQADYQTLSTNFASNPSLSMYGFTLGYGTVPATTTYTTTLVGQAGNTGAYVQFNPYIFAATVAITVIQTLAECSQEEQMLAIHRGSNLSSYVKTECINDVPLLGCLEWQQTYCSFNSVLAKIINRQGGAQLGISSSNCGGLTPEQISNIDFTRIDFGEFVSSVTNAASHGHPTNMQQNYTPVMQSVTGGSAQTGTSSVIPNYQP